MMRWLLKCFVLIIFLGFGTSNMRAEGKEKKVLPGACQMAEYLAILKGKRVALLINQTSTVNGTSLLDTLLKNKIKVVKIFVPEHGFRGFAEAGETVNNETDKATGLPIISLYGKNKKPQKDQLKDVDILVYDLQDVGARFYTYISTMQYAMEACGAYHVQMIILDRPNPNGNYVDGPVLDTSLRSFVGMQPVPIVYGMTAGEYAKMLAGEKWCINADKLNLKVIPCKNYDHNTLYELPVSPSPNLKSMAAIYCYPSLCLFEGTVISVGRGTPTPFQIWGHPDLAGKTVFSFIPQKPFGGPEPLYVDRTCYGQVAAANGEEALDIIHRQIRLFWLIRAYEWYPYKEKFFNSFFEKLAGTRELRKQVESGMKEEEIRATWQKNITAFKKIRKKYLLYTDFE